MLMIKCSCLPRVLVHCYFALALLYSGYDAKLHLSEALVLEV